MTRIPDLIAAGRTLSFEFFPPKTAAGAAELDAALQELAVLRPSFISVTYGALGSTRANTRDRVNTRINPSCSLKCGSGERSIANAANFTPFAFNFRIHSPPR